MRKQTRLGISLLLMLVLAGCVKRAGTTTPASPWEQVMVYNQMLAEANNTVAHTVVNANQAKKLDGSPLLPDATTRGVLVAQAKAAGAHKQLTLILNKGPEGSSGDLAALQGLVEQLRQSGKQMVASGDLGIKDPQSQVTIAIAVDTYATLVETLVGALRAAGVGGIR